MYDNVDGIVASVPGAVADPTVYHNYQVYVSGFHITCYIDGVKRIDWTDPNSRYASGYVSAQVYKTDASFDDFALAKFPRPTPVVTDDGVYTTNLSSLHAAWDIADTNQTGFQYSVGLSAGATNVVPWTSTTNKSATLALTLHPAWTYYVNVQAVYPGGILGPMASTDGITAEVGAVSPFGSVTLTNIPTLSGDTTQRRSRHYARRPVGGGHFRLAWIPLCRQHHERLQCGQLGRRAIQHCDRRGLPHELERASRKSLCPAFPAVRTQSG